MLVTSLLVTRLLFFLYGHDSQLSHMFAGLKLKLLVKQLPHQLMIETSAHNYSQYSKGLLYKQLRRCSVIDTSTV